MREEWFLRVVTDDINVFEVGGQLVQIESPDIQFINYIYPQEHSRMQDQTINNPILDKYWKQANSLYIQATSRQLETDLLSLPKIKIMKQLSENFLTCYCKHIDPSLSNIFSVQQQILSALEQQWKIGQVPINFLIGYSIFSEISHNQLFTCLITRIQEILKTDVNTTKNETGIKLEFDLSLDDLGSSSEEEIPNFYELENKNGHNITPQEYQSESGLSSKYDFNQSFIISESDLTLQLPPEEQQVNSNLIPNENRDIRDYLNKLSKATTQLSYLCQHLKWSQPNTSDKRSVINDALFSSLVEVNVRIKEQVFHISGFCEGALSKKQARRIASLFVLRKIYNRFPQIWLKFKNLRENNQGIQQPLNANNQQIFKNASLDVLDVMFFKQDNKMSEKDLLGSRINEYLQTIASYKNQLNILIGKFKQISPPIFQREKQNQMGLWPVFATITDKNHLIKAQQKQISKKKAEQKCCRNLLYSIYKRDQKRWQSFIQYKKQKCL